MTAFQQEKFITAQFHFSDSLKEKADFNDAKYYLYISNGPFSAESALKLQELKKRKAKLDAFLGRKK